MKQFLIIAISCGIFGKTTENHVDVDHSFPANLAIGAGSAAYQIEGAWNVSGKGESIWDRWTHTNPGAIDDRSNGDIACNFYYKYKEDVQRIKATGLKFYRFSISWARVLPNGYTNVINEDGLQYYKNLTKELVANGITPMVTLFHWDHPEVLEDFGGWINDLIIDIFVAYARIMFETLGGYVKIWTTFNEPNIFCTGSYENALPPLAPGKKLIGFGKYLCVHNILKAHAKTYRMYDEEFRATQKGEIGIVPHCQSYVAANPNDTKSVETAYQFECGWIAHAIFIGDYPPIMKERIAMVSKAQGFKSSRLPKFSDKWIACLKGSADYFGLNHYTSTVVSPDPDEKHGKYNSDNGLIRTISPNWPATAVPGLFVAPKGFRRVLRWIKNEYSNPPVRVMENGYSDNGTLDDYDRIQFHYDYLENMLAAIKQDKCHVKSYSIWALTDDFEWNSGYLPKFGLYSVDFNDVKRRRTPRLSAFWWKKVLRERKLLPVPTKSHH